MKSLSSNRKESPLPSIETTQIAALSSSRLNQKESPLPSIETTQIGASQDCWGCGCCFPDPFKGCLQWANRIFDDYCKKANTNGIQIHSNSEGTKKVVVIDGFGTSVFGNEFKNVFLDPDKIDPEKIAYFINQLIKAYDKNTSDDLSVFNKLCSDKENMKFVACSASAGSLLVLSSFLKNQNATEKTIFFQAVVAKLFPLADAKQRSELENNAQKLMEYIAKEVNFVNPPGILFHAGLAHNPPRILFRAGLAHYYYLNPKLQSLAVGKQRLASEEYFIEMISAYLSGGFELVPQTERLHGKIPSFRDRKNALYSSVDDEIVFPFYYVAMFAEELKTYNLDDEKISKFVYKVMQYGDIGKKEGDKLELDGFFHGLINELKLSDVQHKKVSDIAKKYLNIRDGYLALQKTYWRDLQKEYSINLGGINESVIKDNNQQVVANKIVRPFTKHLTKYNLGDEKIFKFIGKVMQHGKIVKKDGNPSELNYDCQGAINELNLSDDQRKEVSDIAKKYLNIRGLLKHIVFKL